MANKRLLTMGGIAAELGVPIHRVQYVVTSRRIRESARAGRLRVFDPTVVDVVRRELGQEEGLVSKEAD